VSRLALKKLIFRKKEAWIMVDHLIREFAGRDLLTAPVRAIFSRLGLLDFTLREGT